MGLVWAASADAALKSRGASSVKIGPSATGGAYLVFETLCGVETSKTFEATTSWRGVPKATASNPATVYGAWSSATKSIATASAAKSKVGGVWRWAVPFESLVPAAAWGASSSWLFSSRKYDELTVQVSLHATYQDGIVGDQPVTTVALWAGWFPDYTITGATYDLNGLDLALSRTSGWERADDTWSLSWLALDKSRVNPRSWQHGRVGNVHVPRTALPSTLHEGRLDVTLDIGAAYKTSGFKLATVSAVLTLKDNSTCDTPKVSVSVKDGAATLAVTDSGDRGVAITRAYAKLRGGLAADDAECAVPGSMTLPLLPAGTSTIEVVGTDSLGSTADSRPATVSVTLDPSQCPPALYDLEAGELHVLRHNVKWSRASAPEATVEKLAGRETSSAWYGTGAQATGTLRADVVGTEAEVGAAIDALQGVRHALLRMPDGYRRPVAVTSVSAERHVGRSTVTVEVTEVDG